MNSPAALRPPPDVQGLPGSGKPWKRWLRLAVTATLLVLIFRLVDLREIADLLRSADPLLLVAALVIYFADRLFMIGKWLPLLWAQLPQVTFPAAARAYFATHFAALFLPATIGGDVLRSIAVGQSRKATLEVGASVAMERMLGVVGAGMMALVALPIALRSGVPVPAIAPWALAATLASVAALVLPLLLFGGGRPARFFGVAGEHVLLKAARTFASAYGAYRDRTALLLLIGVLSFVEQWFGVVLYWTIARSLGLGLSLTVCLSAVPLIAFVERFPLGLSSLGISEAAAIYFLRLFHVQPAEALAMAIAARVIDLAGRAPGALFWRELVSSPERTGAS